uniref:Si:dkey-174n20.1 n=1 Tax=Callorhinchus milii TaxID=7868 RepID=A0A4W3JPR9_CALMI
MQGLLLLLLLSVIILAFDIAPYRRVKTSRSASRATPSRVVTAHFVGETRQLIFAQRRPRKQPRVESVAVAGGNSGIGKETAVHLARRGARVIIACRDPVRAEAAVTDIRRRSLSLAVHHRQLDLASLASVRHFCRCFLEAEKRLDVLINNAGSNPGPGEICFGTNHLGPFLLTNLLLDRLRESAPSRVVTVSSDTYTFAKLDFSRLNAEGNRFANYSRSKLANILFTRELARRLEGTGVTAHSLHPGYIFTNWASHYSLGVRLVCYLFMSLFFISSELGSQTTIHCATSDQVLAHNGGYFSNCQPAKLSAQALDERAAKKLWDTSEQLVGLSH